MINPLSYGDLSRFTPGNCPCGFVLRNMEVVKGRVSNKKELAGIELSMAELDEVLFPVDGVLDFQWTIEEADGMDYIYLNLMKAESQTLDEQGIHRTLQTIPAIRNGMDQDQLKVVVNVSENRFPVSKGTLKREILDNRLNC